MWERESLRRQVQGASLETDIGPAVSNRPVCRLNGSSKNMNLADRSRVSVVRAVADHMGTFLGSRTNRIQIFQLQLQMRRSRTDLCF